MKFLLNSVISSLLLSSAAAFAPQAFKPAGLTTTQLFETAEAPTVVMTDDYKSATIYGSKVADEKIRNIAVM